MGPANPAADIAVESESPEALEQLLTDEVLRGLRAQFEVVMEKKDFAPDDVAAGRAFLEAYVPFIHYVERIHAAAVQKPEGHFDSY